VKRFIATVVSFVVVIPLGLVVSPPKTAADEISPVSDILSWNIVQTGDRVDLVVIREAGENGQPIVFQMPATVMDFKDPDGSLSDRLIIDPFLVAIRSDTNATQGGFPPRQGAIQFREADPFFPPLFRFTVISDANPTETAERSDTLTVIVFGDGAFNQQIFENGDEQIEGTISPFTRDISEDGVVSDQVDTGPIHFLFTSDLNPGGTFPEMPAPPVVVFQFPESRDAQTEIMLDLRFTSDVPAPPALILLLLGALILLPCVRGFRQPHGS